MRVKAVIMLLLLASAGLAACGRKDIPDFPPDAVSRPATLPGRSEPVRYF